MKAQRKWTPQRRKRFLDLLRAAGNVTAAAEAAGISRSSAYAARNADAAFRAAWDDAVEGALDDLEAELHRRAKEGISKPVYYAGKPVGSVTSYSDNLAMFLLRSRRPHIYGEAAKSNAGDAMADGIDLARETRRRLEEKLARMDGSAAPAADGDE